MKLDIKNRLIHTAIGALFLPFWFIFPWLPVPLSLLCGVCVEVWQYYFRDDRELKLDDRIPDAISYMTLPVITFCLTILVKYI